MPVELKARPGGTRLPSQKLEFKFKASWEGGKEQSGWNERRRWSLKKAGTPAVLTKPGRTRPDQRGLKASARSRRKNSWYSLTFIKSIDSLAKKSGAGEMAHGLLFQRTQLLLPAPTWQLPVICVVRG